MEPLAEAVGPDHRLYVSAGESSLRAGHLPGCCEGQKARTFMCQQSTGRSS